MSNPNGKCHECDDQEGPVTVSVSRLIIPGQEAIYESWLRQVSAVAATFPGHMGVNFIRPNGVQQKDYVTIFRFDTYRNLASWEDSPQRYEMMEQLQGVVAGEAQIQKATGLEFWFNLPEVPAAKAPSPHKMALVLIVVVYILVFIINLLFGTWLAELPLYARVGLVVVGQVLLMTYLVMPRVTRLLQSWLFSASSPSAQ
jgi:hypothetical protein